MYSIVKELTGEVSINSVTSGETVKRMNTNACLFFSNRKGGVYVVDSLGGEFWIDISLVNSTQVLPAAAVPFTGTSRDLYELLEASFFYNVVNPPSGGGGGVVESNIIYPAVNVALSTSDYIVVPSSSIAIELPEEPPIGQTYKIYANNNSIIVGTLGADLIIGKASVSIRKYSAIIVQYVALNTWQII